VRQREVRVLPEETGAWSERGHQLREPQSSAVDVLDSFTCSLAPANCDTPTIRLRPCDATGQL
jgi:hypothetical protein